MQELTYVKQRRCKCKAQTFFVATVSKHYDLGYVLCIRAEQGLGLV